MELKLDSRSARCDTVASRGCEGRGGGGEAAGELNFPIACYYRTNKLQSGTLCSLPHCPHCSLHPVTLGNASRGCKGGSCARQPSERNHFHKEASAPGESSKLPLDRLRAGKKPNLDSLSMSLLLLLLLLSQPRLKPSSLADRMNWLKNEMQEKARFERNVIESQRFKILSFSVTRYNRF